MLKRFSVLAIGILSIFGAPVCANSQSESAKRTHKVTKFSVDYPQELSEKLVGGLPLALGSGLHAVRENEGYVLYFVSDRGPVVEKIFTKRIAAVKEDGMYFHQADFVPFWAEVRIRGDRAVIDRIQTFRDWSGKAILGMPSKKKVRKKAKKEWLSQWHPFDGIDPEGIALESNGDVWIANELGPSLLRFDHSTGNIEKIYAPGSGLPLLLTSMQPNRGFESVVVTKKQKLYSVLQSTLDIKKKTKNKAQFLRFIEIDLLSEKVRMFAYPIAPDNVSAGEARVSDLCFVDDSKMLALEQGTAKKGKSYKRIYLVELADASELEPKEKESDELEFESDSNKLFGKGNPIPHPLRKSLVLDLADIEWPYDKPEGLSLLDDRKTLTITQDNDFGVLSLAEWKAASKKDKNADVIDRARKTQVWFVELEKSIS